jgi:hypothetical protein
VASIVHELGETTDVCHFLENWQWHEAHTCSARWSGMEGHPVGRHAGTHACTCTLASSALHSCCSALVLAAAVPPPTPHLWRLARLCLSGG